MGIERRGNKEWVPLSRKKGNKAPEFRAKRELMATLERGEWIAHFRRVIETLHEDEEIWRWVNHNPRWRKKCKGKGLHGDRVGRPFDSPKQKTPDTRNLNWDEI